MRSALACERSDLLQVDNQRRERLSVLVVAADCRTRADLREYLLYRQHEVHEAADGHAALRLGFETALDALVIDAVLPGRMGAAVAHDLQAKMPWIAVIYLSDYAREYAVPERFFGAGPGAFFLKPCNPAALERTMRRLVQGLAV